MCRRDLKQAVRPAVRRYIPAPGSYCSSILGSNRLEIDAERSQLTVEMRPFHADAFRQLTDLAVA